MYVTNVYIYIQTHALESLTPKKFGSNPGRGKKWSTNPLKTSPLLLQASSSWIDASSIDFSLQFLKVGFLPQQMHRWIYRWSRRLCKQLRYIIDKQKVHPEKSNNFAWYHPTKEHIYIYKTHGCTLSGNPIWYAPHAPTLIATTTSLTFCCDVVLCDSNTSHFYNNKVDSRFTGFLGFIDSN